MVIVRTLDEVRTRGGSAGEDFFTMRRIVILQRGDGLYSVLFQYYSVSEYDGDIISEGWVDSFTDGIYETMDIAEFEGVKKFENMYKIKYWTYN